MEWVYYGFILHNTKYHIVDPAVFVSDGSVNAYSFFVLQTIPMESNVLAKQLAIMLV